MPRPGWPIEAGGALHGVVVVDLGGCAEAALPGVLRQLHRGGGWLEALFLRRATTRDGERMAPARTALELVAAVGAGRGLVGVLRRGRIRLLALSQAADLRTRLRLADSLANAMEEAVDQLASVAWPAGRGQERRVSITHRDHVQAAKLGGAFSFVLTAHGRPLGAVTLERDEAAPVEESTVALCEAVAAVVGPVLAVQREADRLLGGRAARGLTKGWRLVFGPRHPAVKLAALLVAGVALWLALAIGELRISGAAHIEGKVQQALVAPFDGFVASAAHRAGDVVREGEVIARLDTRKMRLDALRYQSQQQEARLKQRDAQGKHDMATAEVEGARAAEAGAQLALERDQIARARLVAPFRGLIVSGDLSQKLGSPVERGKVLFEVAPLDRYRVVVQVDEHDIRFVHVGERARLVLSGLPGRELAFTVSRVVPVAVAVAEGGEEHVPGRGHARGRGRAAAAGDGGGGQDPRRRGEAGGVARGPRMMSPPDRNVTEVFARFFQKAPLPCLACLSAFPRR